MSRNSRFWVLHLSEDLRAPSAMFPYTTRFSIQRMALGGGPSEEIHGFDTLPELAALSHEIDATRIWEAAISLQAGSGLYVDSSGRRIEPF